MPDNIILNTSKGSYESYLKSLKLKHKTQNARLIKLYCDSEYRAAELEEKNNKLEELNESLIKQIGEVEDKNNELAKQLRQTVKEVEEKNKEIEEKDRAIEERDKEIAALKERLNEQGKQAAAKQVPARSEEPVNAHWQESVVTQAAKQTGRVPARSEEPVNAHWQESVETQAAPETPQNTSTESFRQHVMWPDKADAVISKLHQLIDRQTAPIMIVEPIRAAMDAGAIKRPPFPLFCKEFGAQKLKSKASYSKYTNDDYQYYGNDFSELVSCFKKIKGE